MTFPLKSTITRRAALGLILSSASAAILAACGGTAAPSSAPASSASSQASAAPASTAASAAASAKPATSIAPVLSAVPASSAIPAGSAAAAKPSAAPKAGGTLRAGLQTDLPNVDPHFNSPSGYDTLWQAFDRLIQFDNKLQPQPMLAESWDLSPDYKKVTFHLRKGVTFSTGREFTSDDVKYNFLRVRDPKINGGGWVAFSSWWTIDTPDKNTITLTSDTSRPLLFDNLETFNIIDKDTAEGPNAKSQAVGTGPFILKEWAQGDHISLLKNKNYWQAGKPYLDAIEYKILTNAQTMVAQLEAGALDMVLNPPLLDLGRLKSDAKYQAVVNPYTGRYYTVGWNVATKPQDSKLVRQALNYAMDRKRFVDTLLQGLGRPITLPWLPNTPAYDDKYANYFAFDLDKAKSLLQQAGAGNFTMEYLISPNFPELADFGQIYQADLAKIGVTATIKQADSAAFFDAINNRKYPGMYAITSARANLAPGITILSTNGYIPDTNNEGFKDDAYSQLANSMAVETDPAKQKQIYGQMNQILVDEAFCTALATASPRMLLRSTFQGLDYTMHEGFVWNGVYTTA
ncbi:MAG: ABC transporter substrate-binding protein [Chloroflexi bacterium]|nr:ABC transporter substrate-binding protein [Chloroflexota bacterium]